MIDTINVSKTITVPAYSAWQAIANIGGLDRWFSVIRDCKVLGSGVGAMRVLTLTDGGGEIKDRIELIDHQHKRFRYNRIESPFPVSFYLGTVEIHDTAERACELSWTVEIEAIDEDHDELIGFIQQALAGGIDGLERDLKSSAALLSE